MVRIDFERFMKSLFKQNKLPKEWETALNEQGLKFDENGEIVSAMEIERGKWYKCIISPQFHMHFHVGKVYLSGSSGCLTDELGEDRYIRRDIECFRPATDDEIPYKGLDDFEKFIVESICNRLGLKGMSENDAKGIASDILNFTKEKNL